MGTFINLIGMRFGRLVVLKLYEERRCGKIAWECICDCGNVVKVAPYSLRSGHTQSCGCIRKEVTSNRNYIHGYDVRGKVYKEYSIWVQMKMRCYNEDNMAYENYGGRGIKVCDRWINSFENFLEDMGKCPKGYSLDRINNNGNYEPNNCKWVTRREQNNNRRDNVIISYNNVNGTISFWAKVTGIPRYTIYQRFRKGWKIKDIFSIPNNYRKNRRFLLTPR